MTKKRDHREMEKRRLRSVRLFEKGYSGAEVARRLGVARQVAHRWKRAWEVGGKEAFLGKLRLRLQYQHQPWTSLPTGHLPVRARET